MVTASTFAFVHEGTGAIKTMDYVGHSGFVSAEGGYVGNIIFLVRQDYRHILNTESRKYRL